MLDTKLLRQDPAAVAARLAVKGFRLDVDEFSALEAERKRLQSETERLQNERNVKSKGIGQAKSRGEDIQPLLDAVKDLGDELDAAKREFDALQTKLRAFLEGIPNIPDESVPEGKDESDNQELRRWANLPECNFEAKDHVDLGADGALDFETAAKITGSRFVVLHGVAARLQRALTQFMLDVHTREHGYEEVYVPFIANADSLFGTGQLPKFAQDQFRLEGEEVVLDGSFERRWHEEMATLATDRLKSADRAIEVWRGRVAPPRKQPDGRPPLERLRSVNFGPYLRFAGFNLHSRRHRPGGRLDVSLVFKARRKIPKGWKLFVHLHQVSPHKFANVTRALSRRRAPLWRWRPGRYHTFRLRMRIPRSFQRRRRFRLLIGIWHPKHRHPRISAPREERRVAKRGHLIVLERPL